jgi:HEAT repeat protein
MTEVENLIQALRQGDWPAIIDSAVPETTIELLSAMIFESSDEIVRQAATGALGALAEIGAPGAVDALLKLLDELQGSYATDIAAFYLVGCGDSRAFARLQANLENPAGNGHAASVRALAEVGDPRAIEPLIAIINDSRIETRHELVRILGNYDDVRAVFPLLRLLHHDDARVAAAARQGLLSFAEKYAYGMLIEYLTHQDYSARRQAAIALGEIGSRRAIRPLIRVADSDTDVRVQQAIRDALQKLGYHQRLRSG